MATSVEPTVSISPTAQAAFTQRKLEELYLKTYQRLAPFRGSITFLQEVLVWRRPLFSALLYLSVHWLFATVVQIEGPLLLHLSSLLFWLLLLDILWRAATRNGEGIDPPTTDQPATGRRRSTPVTAVSFDTALVRIYTPKGSHELAPFEEVCLRAAEALMWMDNIWLALRHWSIHDPLVFSIVLAVPGVVLSLLGKYIPSIVLVYIAVMGVLVWPYVEYHSLRPKAVEFVHAHFPGVVQQARAFWEFLKTHAILREDRDPPELSLVAGNDETTTTRALQEAFEEATSLPKSEEEEETGLSLLQDSVLGMPPGAFHDAEFDSIMTSSLAPGPGEFPSISQLDQSLAAPTAQPPLHPAPWQLRQMPPIEEEVGEEPQDDLDPFTDSIDVEFGFDFMDRQRRSKKRHHYQFPRQPAAPVYMHAPQSWQLPQEPTSGSGRQSPPPSYEAVMAAASGYYTHGNQGFQPQDYPPSRGLQGNIEGMVPRSSSTPVMDDYQARGRQLRQRDIQNTNT